MRFSHLSCAGLSLLAASVLLASPGCSGKSGGNSVQVVASLHDMTEPFFVAVKRELDAEAARLGVSVSVEDGQSNSAKQTADIEAAITGGAQGIILAPNDVNALTPGVEEVIKAGIPIVTLDRRVDHSSVKVPHVGADNVAGGRIMAQWAIDSFPNGARVLLITGQLGSSPSIDRTRGIKEGLAAAGAKYQIVAEQSGNWKREQGLTVTQNVLTSLGAQSLQAVVAESDEMALGALEALRSSGAQPTREQMEGVRKDTNAKITLLLNDDQKTKFTAWQQERRQHRRGGEGGGEATPPPPPPSA